VDFQLKFNIPESHLKIEFSDPIVFLGSCFSDEMSLLAKQHGFHVTANPFGTLFHPLAIAQNILDALHEVKEVNIVQYEDLFFDYSCSGKLYGMREIELEEKVLSIRNHLKSQLENASYLFVTFGTAFAYHLNETQKIVGNCHKQPSQTFTKKLTEIEEVVSVWHQAISEIKSVNPKIQICFTVSPVRHVKDGLHENNLSKSSLILAINQLMSKNEINYFPAYELVNDVLRDYRFFKEDFVHPNQQAIQFVWEKIMQTFLNSETLQLAKKVKDIKLAMQHKLQYPESKMALDFQQRLDERKRLLETDNMIICWDI
jgi:hypothetical protein